MTREEKIEWMAVWAAKHGCALRLEGECGFGRECVGVSIDDHYPDYHWYDANYEPADSNGDVWTPPDAYHKHSCVAVLGRGENAESQLYDWLKWFDDNGFELQTGDAELDPRIPAAVSILLAKHRYARMVRR